MIDKMIFAIAGVVVFCRLFVSAFDYGVAQNTEEYKQEHRQLLKEHRQLLKEYADLLAKLKEAEK